MSMLLWPLTPQRAPPVLSHHGLSGGRWGSARERKKAKLNFLSYFKDKHEFFSSHKYLFSQRSTMCGTYLTPLTSLFVPPRHLLEQNQSSIKPVSSTCAQDLNSEQFPEVCVYGRSLSIQLFIRTALGWAQAVRYVPIFFPHNN